MHVQYLDYMAGDVVCEGYVAYDDAAAGRRPCVLVCHAWSGQSDAERAKAVELAGLGYVAFAVDVYGKGVRGGLLDDNSKLMQPFMDDRALLRDRMLLGLETARSHPAVDPDRVAAIGFCFGGLCALDLARSGGPGLKGVVSIHGLFHPPNLGPQEPVSARVLLLHGYDDPMAPPDQLLGIAKELSDAKADWQVHAYGNTMHAFTLPGANMPERGIAHNPTSARRADLAMRNFLDEVLA